MRYSENFDAENEPMPSTIFTQTHAVEGELVLELAGEHVLFRCRWPFDLTTDQWIVILITFHISAYSRGIADLTRGKTADIQGLRGGKLVLAPLSETRIWLHAVDCAASRASELYDVLCARADDFRI